MAIIKQKDIYDDSKKVFDLLNKELDALIKKEAALIAQNKALQESFKSLNRTNDGSEAKKLNDITVKLTKDTVKLKEVNTATVRVNKQILKENVKLANSRTKAAKQLALVRQETLKNNKANRDYAKGVLKMNKGLGGLAKSLLGTLGVVGGMMAFVNVLKNAFKISVEFGKASSGLAAILLKTKKEITVLTDQAKLLGSTTAFTASEVIKLQTELARLGFEINDIKNATPSILDLAAALEVNLADAAMVAGGVVKAFGLSTKDTKEVADSMVATLSNSGATFESYRESVKLAAPIFKAANIDFKTMNLLIGKLADSQIKGSLAGTGLKNLVSKLSDENSKLSKELGFTVKNSDDLIKAFELLKTKNIDLTEATELTDERSKAAFLTLIQGVDSADKLSTALNNLDDNAKKTADTMLNNLAGDMTKAQSAWEGFVLSVSDGTGTLSESFRSLTQTWTEFLGGLQKINEEGFVTKMKVMANGVISFIDAITLGTLDKAFKNITGEEDFLRFNTDKAAKALGLQKIELDKNEKSTRRLTTAEKEENEQLKKTEEQRKKNTNVVKKNTRAKKENRDETGSKTGGDGVLNPNASPGDLVSRGVTTVDPIAFENAENEKKLAAERSYLAKKRKLNEDSDKKTAAISLEIEEQLLELKGELLDGFAQLASDMFAAGQEARLAKLAEDNEAEKTIIQAEADAEQEILDQKLEDGLITEAEFKEQSLALEEESAAKQAAIDKKFRIAQAKADKKKALIDIAIATAVASIKVLPAWWLIPAIIAAGLLQAAFVAATPLPTFEKGGEVGGERHSRGGTLIEAEKGEFMVNRGGYANAPELTNMINDGLVKDSDFNLAKNYNNYDKPILNLNGLSSIEKNTHKTNEYLKNMFSSYAKNGEVIVKNSNGEIFKHRLNG